MAFQQRARSLQMPQGRRPYPREGEAAAALMDELNDLVDTIFVELSSEETARLPDQVWDLLGRIIGPDDGE
jgi:hypothetical protein